MDQRAAVGAASWCCSGVPRTVSWGLEVRFEPEAEVWYPAVLWTHYTSTSPPGEFCLHPLRADEGVCVCGRFVCGSAGGSAHGHSVGGC